MWSLFTSLRLSNHWLLSALSCVVVCFPAVTDSKEPKEPLIVTYRSAESVNDKRYDYDLAVLQLALEKTIDEYGEFRLEPSGPMNYARAIHLVEKNQRANFFIKLSYEQSLPQTMNFVGFPIDLGIVGYRVCFISPTAKAQLPEKLELSDIKALRHGQGRGWADVGILRANGFEVFENSSYEGLFLMVANNRVDLFCRGANELYQEYQSHASLSGIEIDQQFVLYYPLPRFFYTHKANTLALERVSKGLKKAFQDGSIQTLWRQAYGASLDFAALEARQLFPLTNPNLQQLESEYFKYFYQPDAFKR
ncbi:hypothetical protein M1D72_12710 [Vibrio sp. AK197]